jgi:Protein of unknown function (DUF1501)
MMTIHAPDPGLSRRAFLRIGALGLGGLSLPWLLESQARAALAGKPLTTGKSVIFLFLHGGPSQTETFDPKMTAPEGIRSVTGEVSTTLPGVTYGSTYQKLAVLANKVAVVRSYRPGSADHDIKPLVHRETLNASLGAIYARVAGMNHPATGIPTNVALFPRAVDPKTQPPQLGFGNFGATGPVGTAFAPFVPGGTGNLLQDMQLKLSRDRLDDRRHLLGQLDALRRDVDAADSLRGLDRIQQQAFDVILRGVAQAFDLGREDAKTIARYDTAPLVRPENIDKKWKNYNNYVDNAKTLGKLLLLARRLCEAGCGFVTVTTNFVWDMHADVNNAGVAEGMRYMGLPLDHAVSAYIEDVEARGLDEKILLVVAGEMGRTPRVNKNGGRDHWGNLGPLLLHGGGLKMGQVIGQSTANAGDPSSEPVTMHHLIATIMHTLLHPGEVRIARGMPEDVGRLVADGEPIRGL